MNETAILWPAIIMALITLILYVPMAQRRASAVKAGNAKASDFKITGKEPDESAQFVKAIANQYEMPVLFYAACVMAIVAGAADFIMVGLAWVFALGKLIHILVFITSNNLRLRRPVFMIPWFALILMWLWLAINLATSI
ncbi:MAG: MAPEG family protein [Pseudomonadota bacterium]